MHAEDRARVRALFGLFLKLGTIGFGGPAAHIALMRDEVVGRRRWVSDQHFLDLVGATSLIPGPNSTELAIHIGRERAGWRGSIVAGAAFIAPAALIVLGLASLYVRYGSTPAGENLMYGIAPVVIAVIVAALGKLATMAVKNLPLAGLGVAVLALYLAGVNELLLLVAAAFVSVVAANPGRIRSNCFPAAVATPSLVSSLAPATGELELGRLFLLFLKFGSVVFGSGYVLLAFLRADLVSRLGWLTNEQLVDAVAVGQFTPGPVFTTATFVGYIVAGLPGAFVATFGIFLPSFVLVGVLNPLIPRIRESRYLGAALDGVNVAALGLMAGVVAQLGSVALVDPLTIVLMLLSLVVIVRVNPNPVWLILIGGAVGLLHWWTGLP